MILADLHNAVGSVEKSKYHKVTKIKMNAASAREVVEGVGKQMYPCDNELPDDVEFLFGDVPVFGDVCVRPDIIEMFVKHLWSMEKEWGEWRRYSVGAERDKHPALLEIARILYGKDFDDPPEFAFNSRDNALEGAWRIVTKLQAGGMLNTTYSLLEDVGGVGEGPEGPAMNERAEA